MTKGEVCTEGRSVAAAADAKTGGAGESAEPPLTRQSGTEFGRVLPRQRTIDALCSSELHPVETSLYAHLFARAVVNTCVVNRVRSRIVIAEEDGSAA